MDGLLGAAEMREAFRRLALRLERRQLIGDICVFGGAAMILAYGARRVTRDVDALFEPHGAVVEESRAVARELGFPEGWLNDAVSVYVPPVADTRRTTVYDHPNLRVRSVSARHLLAMKALAARRYASDKDDLVTLVRLMGLTESGQVERICAEVFPDEPLSDHSLAVIREAVAIAVGDTDGTTQ